MTDLLDFVRPSVRDIPLENIANMAKEAFDKSEIIPLWFGEGDIPTPRFICDAADAAMKAGHVFYTHQNGIPELRAAIADYLTGLDRKPVTPDRVTVTVGGMGAIMLAIQLVVDQGDNVVVVDPVWPNIGGATQIQGGIPRSVRMDLSDNGGWQLDLDKLAAACDARTKAVFFASPGNPTGAVLSVETQRALLDFCRARGIWIIADEVYNRMVFDQHAGPSIADIAEPDDRVLIINSFSKSWAMTGWRLGWLVHPPSLGPRFACMTQYTNSGIPTFLQYAAVTALREGESFVAEMRAYCRQGAEIVCDAFAGMSRIRMRHRPGAAMYAFFEIDGMPDSRAACLDILRRTKVGLAPGIFFGKGSETFIRLCFCRTPDSLHQAMERLRPVLR